MAYFINIQNLIATHPTTYEQHGSSYLLRPYRWYMISVTRRQGYFSIFCHLQQWKYASSLKIAKVGTIFLPNTK